MTSPGQKDFRIFEPVDELLNLILPVLMIGFVISDVYFHWPGFQRTLFNRILIDIILLNVTHNAFTYIMLFCSPELKPWLKHQGSGSERSFWLRITALNLGLALIFFGLLNFFNSPGVKAIFYFVSIFFPIHHALSQSFGLSLVYNYKLRGSETLSVARIKLHEGIERKLSKFFLVLIIFTSLFLTLKGTGLVSVADHQMKWVWPGLLILVFLSSFTLIAHTVSFPTAGRSKKFIFSLGYLIWAFSMLSPLAIALTKIIHGLEYAFVTRKMLTASKAISWKRITALVILIVVILGYFREVLFHSVEENPALPLWLKVVAAIPVAFSYSHYYLDRRLFQFRHDINQKTAGQLLL